jgi:hypothetical protein
MLLWNPMQILGPLFQVLAGQPSLRTPEGVVVVLLVEEDLAARVYS